MRDDVVFLLILQVFFEYRDDIRFSIMEIGAAHSYADMRSGRGGAFAKLTLEPGLGLFLTKWYSSQNIE
jgi:hypothetical protein